MSDNVNNGNASKQFGANLKNSVIGQRWPNIMHSYHALFMARDEDHVKNHYEHSSSQMVPMPKNVPLISWAIVI